MTDKKYTWQNELSNSITNISELCTLLGLDDSDIPISAKAAQQFPMRVPHSFASKMEKNNPNDPLLLQVLPQSAETMAVAGYGFDPLQEKLFNHAPGLLHKYQSRALLITTGACAINCRYCFRRHFPYEENASNGQDWSVALNYIQQQPKINEVILSGGDPLILNDNALKRLIESIARIPHIKILRIHSRMPITLPSRITKELIDTITSTRLKTVLVTHCNHPNEIDSPVATAINALKKANIMLLNQTVLLKAINDDTNTLCELSHKLFQIGILPYYLHLLDKISGAAHFDTTVQIAKKLHQEMQQQLSGYLVPKLVYEQAGAQSKTPI